MVQFVPAHLPKTVGVLNRLMVEIVQSVIVTVWQLGLLRLVRKIPIRSAFVSVGIYFNVCFWSSKKEEPACGVSAMLQRLARAVSQL